MTNFKSTAKERIDEFKAKLWELGLTSEDIDVDTLVDNLTDDLVAEIEGVLGEEKTAWEGLNKQDRDNHTGYNALHRKMKEALNNLKK